MNEVQPFVPHGEATKAMQPRQGAFNDPPGAAEATAVRGTPLGELRGDPAAFEVIPMRLRVIPPVPLNQLGLAGRAPGMSLALLKLSGDSVHDYATISDDSPSPSCASRARSAATS